ncbi:MAG TPA: sodium/glutamate symporter [Planctomycetota bacterium]|nr:sodium/glutamate symporter [Planctomycetota bacterium]
MDATTVPLISVNAVQALGLSCLGLALGTWIVRRVAIVDRLNIPAPIVGGLLFALLGLALRGRWLDIEYELSLQPVLMLAFFTTIGLSASLRLIRVGGRLVVWFLGLAVIGAMAQNGVGIAIASAFGLDPLYGIIAGSIALTGGPGTAAAFGDTFETTHGVEGAKTVGIACAMFGIAAGGLLGGQIGGTLVRRHGLRGAAAPVAVADAPVEPESSLTANVVVIGVAMGLGTLIGMGFQRAGINLPGYIGAMIAAAVLRNVDDATGWFRISPRRVDELGDAALSVFIVMAMLGLQLWKLAHIAAPIVVILVAQVLLVWAMCRLVFRVMGRDYEAAVMSGGFCGFMLGTAANAMACMTVLRDKYGAAPRAFIVVPLVGVSLIDFFNALMITHLAHWFR